MKGRGNVIEFFMPMKIPTVTHQQKKVAVKNGKPIFYEDKRLQDAREKFMSYLSHFAPDERIENTPIRLTTKWLFESGNLVKHYDGEYKITKPDTDNLVKLLKDCMTDLGYWKDDALVASEIIEKFWAKTPGIYVKIEVLDNGILG